MPNSPQNSNLPLQGVKVIDLTRLLPGPVATQHLADMGAEVIKVEDTGAGDYARAFGLSAEQLAAGLESPFFSVINRDKKIIKLNLKTPEDREQLIALVRTADVLIESFRPGVMTKLGLGYEQLKVHNPKLVYCAITGYGQTGPLRDAAGHDINYLACAGAFPALAAANSEPALPNLQIADLMGGALMAAMSTLAAVIGARTTGEGRFIDVAMSEGVLLHNLMQLYAHNLNGASKTVGTDLLNGGVPCYGLYRCADGRHMAVGALELKFWQAMCEVLDKPEWKLLHHELGIAPGSARALATKAELAAIFTTQSQAYWTEKFAYADACVTPVLNFEEALAHPQFVTRGVVKEEVRSGFMLKRFSLSAALGWK
jgi:alpha-methylacyl-CoA racemase